MDDLISRQAAVEVADAIWTVTGDKNVAKVWQQLKELPSAQQERKKGTWIVDNDIPSICSNCGSNWIDDYVDSRELYFTGKIPNYCPNCGSDNRGEQDDA